MESGGQALRMVLKKWPAFKTDKQKKTKNKKQNVIWMNILCFHTMNSAFFELLRKREHVPPATDSYAPDSILLKLAQNTNQSINHISVNYFYQYPFICLSNYPPKCINK